jgi:hypothetical protein
MRKPKPQPVPAIPRKQTEGSLHIAQPSLACPDSVLVGQIEIVGIRILKAGLVARLPHWKNRLSCLSVACKVALLSFFPDSSAFATLASSPTRRGATFLPLCLQLLGAPPSQTEPEASPTQEPSPLWLCCPQTTYPFPPRLTLSPLPHANYHQTNPACRLVSFPKPFSSSQHH